MFHLSELTPSDPNVKKEFAKFKDEVTKAATHILSERMPQKILYFNKLVSEKPSEDCGAAVTDENVSSNPWFRFEPTCDFPFKDAAAKADIKNEAVAVAEEESPEVVEMPPCKRRRMMSTLKEQVIFEAPYPAHPQIYKMTEEIKKEVAELIEMAGAVKLFIQLNVPRIEGGNNFGVQIQEEAIQELCRVEDAAFGVCSAIVEYFTTRATIATKIIKFPNVQDFKEALRELDEKKWILLKVTRIDMRNNYAMLYDLLSKNWERVVKPRHSDSNAMIY